MFDKSKLEENVVDGVCSLKYTDDTVYKEAAKAAGLTVKELEGVDKFRSAYTQEASSFAKTVAEDKLKKDKKLSKVIVEVPFTTSKRSNITTSVEREAEIRIPTTGAIEKRPKMKTVVKDSFIKHKKHIQDLEKALRESL